MRRAAICVVTAGLLVGCSSSSKPEKVVTLTRTVVPPGNASTSAATHTTSVPAPSVPTHQTRLGGTCDTLLPDGDVIAALGGAQLAGIDAFVVGVPEKDIGRLAYLNCRYGVTGKGAAATPKIEIGISLYNTPTQANARITATVNDYSAHGATGTDTTVAGHPATLLTGGTGAGYDEPLLVVSSGQRTVAVSIAPAVATGSKAAADAAKLAELALQRTGG